MKFDDCAPNKNAKACEPTPDKSDWFNPQFNLVDIDIDLQQFEEINPELYPYIDPLAWKPQLMASLVFKDGAYSQRRLLSSFNSEIFSAKGFAAIHAILEDHRSH